MDFINNLEDYLTEEEKQQITKLLRKAADKRDKDERGAESESFIYWQVQYNRERKKLDKECVKKKFEFETELQRMMELACSFCQKYGYCEDCKKLRMYDEDDEELPFDISENSESDDEKAEWEKSYQAGRMSMLFSLVDEGKMTLDEAAEHAGMTWEEAEDMLRGWQVAQEK